jgi:hypothetical protein
MAEGGAPADDPRFAALARAMVGLHGVAVGTGRKGFGSGALTVDGRIFAMLRDDRLVLKLPRTRVTELVDRAEGSPFDAGKGRPMNEWVIVTADADAWPPLAHEALAFVAGVRSTSTTPAS